MKKLIAILLLLLVCAAGCAPREPFRLHVIANSNSAEDQRVKLLVRDEMLRISEQAMLACRTKEEAEAYMRTHTGELIAGANRVLAEQGMTYTAQAFVGRYPFPDKTYAGVTYPAGEYDALRVVLGEGAGENWWCVMFPPLCLVNAEAEAEDVEYHSFLIDWLREVFNGA